MQRFLPSGDGGLPVGTNVMDVPAERAPVDAPLLAGGELLAYGNPSVDATGMYSIPLDAAGQPLGTQTRTFTMLNPAFDGGGLRSCRGDASRVVEDGRRVRLCDGGRLRPAGSARRTCS